MQQMSLQLIHHKVNEVAIDQRHTDGYINATAMCKAAGKKWSHYWERPQTQEFIVELASDAGIPASELIQTLKGGIVQGTWVHPQVSIHLAQWLSAKFAVMVSKWVYDWMNGVNAPVASSSLPDYFNRYLINKPKIPVGYFSILQMTTMELAGPLQQLGYTAPGGMTMDISVGLHYCKHLRKDLDIDPETFEGYLHEWGSARPPVFARLYPNSLLEDFYIWFAAKYLAQHAKSYFGKKDKAALAFLDKMPTLAAPPNSPGLKPPAPF